ncbi:MAG: hypothetical protein LBN30_07980, partial [Oscillospiraceae bacterium]|jgi:hypothetical protein|nr:hypothetical protein [Oscillospiraceae bacterium]
LYNFTYQTLAKYAGLDSDAVVKFMAGELTLTKDETYNLMSVALAILSDLIAVPPTEGQSNA